MPSHDPDIFATIAREEPEFFRYVEDVRHSGGTASIVLNGHKNNKDLVWACLWYALDRGVMVSVAPQVVMNRWAVCDEESAKKPDMEPAETSATRQRDVIPTSERPDKAKIQNRSDERDGLKMEGVEKQDETIEYDIAEPSANHDLPGRETTVPMSGSEMSDSKPPLSETALGDTALGDTALSEIDLSGSASMPHDDSEPDAPGHDAQRHGAQQQEMRRYVRSSKESD
jgi:hypothetical protein